MIAACDFQACCSETMSEGLKDWRDNADFDINDFIGKFTK
jgi:hypothetical protein